MPAAAAASNGVSAGAPGGAPPPASPAPGTPGHSRRVIFIDLARALAVVFMLYGHTVAAVLAPEYKVGTWFEVWTFQRGLTSSLFLLLAGFAFSVATSRQWAFDAKFVEMMARRTRRFGLFILLGYALHFPVARFVELPGATDQQWRAFLAVDVLQLIGVSFVAIQLAVVLLRSWRAFTMLAFVGAAVIIAVTPAVWGEEWAARLPLWMASYLAPATGSLFPLFPWAAFVLIGAGLGQVYARWGIGQFSAYANVVLLVPGVVMLSTTLAAGAILPAAFEAGPWDWVRADVLVRVGTCLIILGALAHASRRISRLPHIFGAVAQESLLIYFVHLCLVYGSVWNRGLAQVFGATLAPGATLAAVVGMFLAMVALAWYWNWWKHTRPRGARWTSYAVGGALVARLL